MTNTYEHQKTANYWRMRIFISNEKDALAVSLSFLPPFPPSFLYCAYLYNHTANISLHFADV